MRAHEGEEVGADKILHEGNDVHQLVLLSDKSAERKDNTETEFDEDEDMRISDAVVVVFDVVFRMFIYFGRATLQTPKKCSEMKKQTNKQTKPRNSTSELKSTGD